MSESSLPPFGPAKVLLFLKTFRPTRLKRTLGRLSIRRRRNAGPTQETPPIVESRAARSVREYLDAHAENLERAGRLEERAGRLEKVGTPSESARNRAERARGEVVSGLVTLRASFVEATGREGTRAFDRAVELLCPAFAPRTPSDDPNGRPRQSFRRRASSL